MNDWLAYTQIGCKNYVQFICISLFLLSRIAIANPYNLAPPCLLAPLRVLGRRLCARDRVGLRPLLPAAPNPVAIATHSLG